MDASWSQCSPCWQARHSVRTPPSFSWRRADAVIRWSRGWPPPDTRHTIQMSESASVTCCSSISRAGLMISRCRLYLLATFSRAVSNTTCSKSWKQNPWTNIKYQMFVNNIELFELIFISRKVRTHSWYWTLFWWSSFIVVSSLILLKDLIIFGKASTFYHRIKLVAESLNWALRLLMKAWVFLSSGFKIKHFSLKQINLIVSISKM